MSLVNGILKAPLGLDEIATAFEANSLVFRTIMSTGNINKWAKYKPVKHPEYIYVTAAQRQAVNQGFENISKSTALAAFNAAADNNADWVYGRPTGQLGVDMDRMCDCLHIESDRTQIKTANGYNKNAANPFALNTIGVYPHANVPSGYMDFVCTWYYRAEEIALTDLAAVSEIMATNNWYWCLFAKIPGNNNQVTVIPLCTALGGSTKVALAAPDSNLNIGYFRLPIGVQTVGTAQAYLGIYALDSVTQGETRYIYIPVGQNANFTIPNASADVNMFIIPKNAPMAGRYAGLTGAWEDVGGQNIVTAFYSAFTVALDNAASLPSDLTIVITETIRGKVGGTYGPYAQKTSTVYLGPNAGASSTIQEVWPQFAPIACDVPGDLQYSVRMEVGSNPPFYLDADTVNPLTHVGSETPRTMSYLIGKHGSNYVEMLQNGT